ncbi:glycosyltransferase, group 2 family protein [Candidatus Stoquefichus sp. KLE1796]|nr:glycosyltransferase, group 2 family protein [Candidatus Stoquefichus sp. KLE1796]
MMDKVSIIMPVYNAELYIKHSLSSVVNQTYSNLEIIIVNDGSTDNTLHKISKYSSVDTRIQIISTKNKGASHARNIGVRESTGKYVFFIDSDDYIEADTIELLHNQIVNNKDVGFVECDFDYVSNHNIKLDSKNYNPIIFSKDELFNRFFRVNGGKNIHSICAKLIRRELITNVKFLEGKMNEDVLALYDLINLTNQSIYINCSLYHYFQNREGVTNKKFNIKQLDLLYIWQLVLNKTKESNVKYVSCAESNLNRSYFTLLAKMKVNGFDNKNIEMQKIKKFLKNKVKDNFFSIIKLKMGIKRKIALIYLLIFY